MSDRLSLPLDHFPTESEVAALAPRVLEEQLGRGWAFEPTEPIRLADSRMAYVLNLAAPDGMHTQLAVEPRDSVSRRLVTVLSRNREELGIKAAFVVASAFIARSVQTALKENDLNYLDLTGNVWLTLTHPYVLISRTGARSNPWRRLAGAGVTEATAFDRLRPDQMIRDHLIRAVMEVVPGARPYLLVSRDREGSPEWHLTIVVPDQLTWDRERRIRSAVYAVEREYQGGPPIQLVLYDEASWRIAEQARTDQYRSAIAAGPLH